MMSNCFETFRRWPSLGQEIGIALVPGCLQGWRCDLVSISEIITLGGRSDLTQNLELETGGLVGAPMGGEEKGRVHFYGCLWSKVGSARGRGKQATRQQKQGITDTEIIQNDDFGGYLME